MRTAKFNEKLDLPIDEAWALFTNLENYPKYFKYINKIFHKGEMRLGSNWYDFTTFIIPIVVKHKTTVFEKEKSLGFDIYIPLKGYVKERINLSLIHI